MCERGGWTATVQEVMRMMCDVILVVGDHHIPAHKEVLCASSAYFRVMFEGGFKESGSTEVNMTESIRSVDMLNALLKFMYVGQLDVTSETLEDILEISSFLLMDEAKDVCAKFMCEKLTFDNWLYTWSTAELFYLESVSEVCMATARCRFRDRLQHQPEMLNLDSSQMVKLAKEGIMDFLDISEIGELLLRWFKKDKKARLTACEEVIELLDHKLSPLCQAFRNRNKFYVNTTPKMAFYLTKLCRYKIPLYKRQHLGQTMKVLVSRPCQPTGSQKRYQVMYVYVPQWDRWYVKDIVIEDSRHHKWYVSDIKKGDVDSFVLLGGTKEGLVFRKTNGGIVVCLLQDDGFQWMSLETQYRSTSVPGHGSTYVVWDGKLMLIKGVFKQCDMEGNGLVHIIVFRYDFHNRLWLMVSKTEVNRDSDLSVIRHFSTDRDLFILTMYGTNRIQLSKLRRETDLNYVWDPIRQIIPALPCPHRKDMDFEVTISKSQLRLKLGNYVYVAPGGKGAPHRFTKYTAEAESCWPVTSRPAKAVPSEGEGFQVIRVNSDMVVPRGSPVASLQGYFFLQVVGRYMTRCWHGVGEPEEPESFVWTECTPPPTERICSYSVVEIQRCLLRHFRQVEFVPSRNVKTGSTHDIERAYSLHHGFA